MHAQQQIINAIVARLQGATDAGGRVFDDNRVDPLQGADLPALVVTGPGGGALRYESIGSWNVRTFVVCIQVLVASASGAAQQARQLGAQVEARLAAPDAFSGLAADVRLTRDPSFDITGDGAALMARVTQWWEVDYAVTRHDPETILTA